MVDQSGTIYVIHYPSWCDETDPAEFKKAVATNERRAEAAKRISEERAAALKAKRPTRHVKKPVAKVNRGMELKRFRKPTGLARARA